MEAVSPTTRTDSDAGSEILSTTIVPLTVVKGMAPKFASERTEPVNWSGSIVTPNAPTTPGSTRKRKAKQAVFVIDLGST